MPDRCQLDHKVLTAAASPAGLADQKVACSDRAVFAHDGLKIHGVRASADQIDRAQGRLSHRAVLLGDISRGELSGAPCFWATIKGAGLPGDGDTRASEDVWELCIDITMAIQEANPEFVAPFRLIPASGRKQRARAALLARPAYPGRVTRILRLRAD